MLFSAIIFATAVALVLANNAPTYPSYISSTTDKSYGSYRPFNAAAPVPQNKKPSNASFADDGCGDSSVRFKGDGYCYPLLKKGPCYSVLLWITVDPYTYEGICTPRLCGREKVFVGRDGLCHDIYDTKECRGGRRLYYSAYGDPICDCPVGQYPFPSEDDDCVPLFTQGPCPTNQVVSVSASGKLECAPNTCQLVDRYQDFLLQLVPVKQSIISNHKYGNGNGQELCHALGSCGPCSPSELFGYNVFRPLGECVDMNDPRTPYFSSPEENAILDDVFGRAANEPNNRFYRAQRLSRKRRQGPNTIGIFQQPSRIPTSLLNPCQPGGRNGNNFKCANPLVPRRPVRDVSQPVSPAFGCRPNDFLQATGQCGSNRGPASCGPSFQFIPATNQCRPIRF
ncbi:uncharacterized protein LOC124196362 [Daphnia pulex]|uniref:uncharacterized protein LOC124196361 n=1 Tax=Daphnia pulex TaxID=6669 RepID=UPI001EDE30FB|nr:uncharacterized protein LOC124196361 [Daphnia pulex]XP_046447338.1 uncharacterized protein LOC124196361 [Daphnia pulex]XP_046447340.1 uncharacterized protein LOC124196361 [Daphnia pulex]XP_046447341.1 uncharacterized protein LOC124196361 [Daphnia pulex]XP_046447342.1 uncharacterized protein LOC124196361 [Daphnia pulex]XP_046447343.1 uncharacterized protein LOC124196362 [Daphnia pulex]XP_046447344.1 uncharacterized protein LOC124196362 [Daphnia pulex]XP_046447345.1 uncharacterized protein 